MTKKMQNLAIHNPQQQTNGHRTNAFGYDRVNTTTLRFTGKSQVIRPQALPAWIQAIVTMAAALARPEVRNGLTLEATRAAFAGLVIFGGWLFLLCSVTFAVAYVAAWTTYGVVKHVDTKLNESSRRQKVLALYAA